MKHEVPDVTILKPIRPTSESARSNHLRYDNLASAVKTHVPHEYQRLDNFWEAEEGSIEELEAAKQAALQYLLMGSAALQDAVSLDSKQTWSNRYTQAAGELYGTPDVDEALDLEQGAEIDDSFESAAKTLEIYINDTYGAALDAVEAEAEGLDELDPEHIARAFESGLAVMIDQYDSEWSDWKVDRDSEKDSLSVVGSEKSIKVGLKRAVMQPEQLKPLFAHEVLVHAQRSLNGHKLDEQLGKGLPGYLDVEEGLGVFFEYALSGEIPQKNVDRYTDIAYALGQIDGHPHDRYEMIERVTDRALERNQDLDIEHKKLYETILDESYTHVNRIYRGSLGDENIGVFTKDIVYHKGFLEAGEYIKQQLEQGTSMEDIIQFLLQGKFDPTNQSHIDYLEQL